MKVIGRAIILLIIEIVLVLVFFIGAWQYGFGSAWSGGKPNLSLLFIGNTLFWPMDTFENYGDATRFSATLAWCLILPFILSMVFESFQISRKSKENGIQQDDGA
ncbi:MAG: hypothetical protein AAFX93_04710 [Verrucomicrobiota bacterium]